MNKLTGYFKILSDETRIRILVLLYHRKLCVCQLCGVMGESQPKISKHLAKLRDTGLIQDERHEQFIYYRLSTTNKLFLTLLKTIVEEIDQHPILFRDQQNSQNVERFIK